MNHIKRLVLAVFLGLMLILAYVVTVPNALAPAPVVLENKHGAPLPPPPPQAEAKVNVANIIDIEWSEGNSWSTVVKLLVIVLGTFLGIKTINAVCRRVE